MKRATLAYTRGVLGTGHKCPAIGQRRRRCGAALAYGTRAFTAVRLAARASALWAAGSYGQAGQRPLSRVRQFSLQSRSLFAYSFSYIPCFHRTASARVPRCSRPRVPSVDVVHPGGPILP
jgi:hypothetical protein